MTLASRSNKDKKHFNKKDSFHFDGKPSSMKEKSSKFCSNNTLAQVYLTQILAVIQSFEVNSSYTSIIQTQSINFIKYLKDKTNQELLKSNCESFIQGLKLAKKADKEYEYTQKKLARNIQKQFKQIARDVNHGKGFFELDF